jgi:hypothetical protein
MVKHLVVLAFLLVPSAAFAAEEITPIMKLEAKTEEMLKGLDKNKTTQFSAIRNSHGTVRAVENVQSSIARAVKACGKANPDMKGDMDAQFESWKEALRPVMKDARAKLDKMIYLQGFARPSDVRAYLRQFDDAVEWRDAHVRAEPISSKDECEKLTKKMSKTQDDLIDLLKENLALDQQVKQE